MSGARLSPPVGPEDHVRGPADAPVTLVEYGDYQCPHCGRAHPIVQSLLRRLDGRLRFAYRHFPITQSHEFALHAAEAAEGAAAQGAFWAMHDTLFEHQNALDDEHLVEYARALELDDERIAIALEENVYEERVRADFMSGVRSGANGTPTFFINGERYDDSWDEATLGAVLERAARAGARA